MAALDQLDVSTVKYIRKDPAVADCFFNNDPVIAMLRTTLKEAYPGGNNVIQENFLYDSMPGGAYPKGGEFSLQEKQVEQGLTHNLKGHYVNISMSLEDVEIFNKGPAAAFPLIQTRIKSAFLTSGGGLAIEVYLNGIRAGYTRMMNGLAEIVNDGVANSWDSNTYVNYGTIVRGGAVGASLNSIPQNINGTIEYNTLVEQYLRASFGDVIPNVVSTTPLGYAYINEKFQPQQRLLTKNPTIGFLGMDFMGAQILISRYCPGSEISGAGTTDAQKLAANWLTESSGGLVTAYPTLSNETIWILNARRPYLQMYITNSALFGGGFTGFKVAQGNTKVAGQMLIWCQVTGLPRYHRQLFNVTG
jgi:hypothetical protein